VALSAAPRAGHSASDAPCRAPRTPVTELLRSTRIASTALASTRMAFPIRSAFHRQVHLYPLTRSGGPPPFPKLCRLGPASGALSLLAMLSHGGARPSTVVTGYSPVVARTARRLSTSAIETIREHNRLIDRTLHTTPESPPAQLFCRWPGPFQGSASRDVMGQGPVWTSQSLRLSPRSLAVKASPQPDRLGHLLSRA